MKPCGRLAWRPELRGKPGGIFLLAGAVVCLLLAYAAWNICGSPIQALVVNQALGYGVNPQTGEFYLMDTFAAGKKTGVFVELTRAVRPDPDCRVQYVRVRHYDDLEDRLCPKATKEAATRLEFQPQNGRKPEDWFPGEYTLTAVIEGDSLSREISFKDTGTLRVLAVPIQGWYGGESVSPGRAWEQAGQFAQTVFPLAEKALEWIPYEFEEKDRNLLRLEGEGYDLDSVEGQYNVADKLAGLQDTNAPYDLIIGFVPQNMAQDHDGESRRSLTGFTFGDSTIVISLADGAVPVTVAHEISHFFGVGDEYQGGSLNPDVNMPPYSMQGWHFVSGEATEGTSKYILAPGSKQAGTGTRITERQFPYDAEKGQPLTARSSYMGLSGLEEDAYWITPQIWEHLYSRFQSHDQ